MILPGVPNQSKELHQKAIKYLNAGRIDDGIAYLQNAIKMAPYDPLLFNNLGQAYLMKQERNEAAKAFKTAFDLDPNNMNTLNNLGILAIEKEQYQQAQAYLERSVEMFPSGNFDALNNLGVLYAKMQLYSQAEDTLKKALSYKPDDYQLQRNLALTLYRINKVPEALELFQVVLEREPEDIGILHFYANLLVRNRDREGAVKIQQRILDMRPENAKAWIDMATSYEHMGEIEKAKDVIERARPYCETLPGYHLIMARVAQHKKDCDLESIALELERHVSESDVTNSSNAPVFYELGKLFDKVGSYDKAFSYFEKANICQNSDPSVDYVDRHSYRNEIVHYKEVFTPEWVESWNAPVPYTEAPEIVFLVGFPRSGTTLLDQILHSHPDIEVVEEYPSLGNLLSYMTKDLKRPYPECLADLNEDEIKEMRRQYFDIHRREGAKLESKVFVDKLPLNLVHAGFIYRLFPNAKFLLALRHPCDCSLSCFMQTFQINAAMSNFLDLETTAELYDDVFSLWEQYEALLPLTVYRNKYEDIVADFKPTVAGLLEYIGVPWDDAVIEYDKTARARGPINTPSYNQVTQKIYTRAKGRWERYRMHMEPVLDKLLPWAEKHGYDKS